MGIVSGICTGLVAVTGLVFSVCFGACREIGEDLVSGLVLTMGVKSTFVASGWVIVVLGSIFSFCPATWAVLVAVSIRVKSLVGKISFCLVAELVRLAPLSPAPNILVRDSTLLVAVATPALMASELARELISLEAEAPAPATGPVDCSIKAPAPPPALTPLEPCITPPNPSIKSGGVHTYVIPALGPAVVLAML